MDNKKRLWIGFVTILLLTVSLLGVLKTVYLSADIDESYAVTLGIRLAHGDKLFKQMWEVHQMSAVLYAPFIAAYEAVTGGVEGLLVFLRMVGVLIQGAVAAYGFFVLRKWSSSYFAFWMSILFFNFTPKHIQSPEFTQLLYWGIVILSLSLLRFVETRKVRHIILMGLALCVCVLAYPFAAVLFPVCMLLFCNMLKNSEKGLLKKSLMVLGFTCLFGFALFVAYVLSGVSLVEWIANIPYVLMDESHNQSRILMLKEHARSVFEMLKVTIVIIGVTHLLRSVYHKRYETEARLILALAFGAEAVSFIISFHTIEKVNFTIFLPLIIQLLVLLLYTCFAYAGYMRKKEHLMEDTVDTINAHIERRKNNELLAVMVIPAVTAWLSVLLSSNLSADYSSGFLLPAVLGTAVVVFREFRTPDKKNTEVFEAKVSAGVVAKQSFYLLLLVFTVLLLTNRVFLVRFTSTQRKNVFEGYYETNHGSLKGIRLGDMDYRQYEAKTAVLREQVRASDVFLYVGCDMFLYSQCEGRIGTGNTISTPAFGEQLLAYYKKYPDRVPTVIFVDREYVADFGVVLQEEPFQSFMEENYDPDETIVDVPVNVYKLKEK